MAETKRDRIVNHLMAALTEAADRGSYGTGRQHVEAAVDLLMGDERERLRDEYAKAALASGLCPRNVHMHSEVAEWANQIADAMLAAREEVADG